VSLHSHPHCVVCGRDHPWGLKLHFAIRPDGGVETSVDCSATLEGYPRLLHGGVIALLLDGAMTHCLFAHGRVAVTGGLTIRYHHPVETCQRATLRAWIKRSRPPLHLMAAALVQDGQVMASASAKFMEREGHAAGSTTIDSKRRPISVTRSEDRLPPTAESPLWQPH
jgi:acyl-coenzyme A thioesterase PaaI-like protein